MKHRSVLFNDKAIINYQDEGNGDTTIVLLHGFMNSLDVWARFAFRFMKEIRVVAIDLLGHGESGDNASIHTMEMQAEMVKAVLDHIGVEKCVIVGHSMGGYIALAFAKLYPNSLKGLCLLNSHAMEDNEKAREQRMRVCEIVKNNKAAFIVNFIPELFYEDSRDDLHYVIKELQDIAMNMRIDSIVASQIGMAERSSKLDVLIDADIPILFITGKRDTRIVVENLFSQAIFPKHSELMMLDNVGHMAHLEAQTLVAERLLSFTKSCYLK